MYCKKLTTSDVNNQRKNKKLLENSLNIRSNILANRANRD